MTALLITVAAHAPEAAPRHPDTTAAPPHALAALHPLEWARRLLPHYFSDPPAPFHRKLFDDLAAGKRLVARVAPRGHAKSTCAALAYPLWCLCNHRRANIVILTHELALATQFVRDIRHELESNTDLIDAYGDLCRPSQTDSPAPRRAKWSESRFTTSTGVTVQAKSVGASFRGTRVGPHRPDLVVCDDIEKDDRVESPDARRKLEHWLRRVVIPALAPDGQLLVLGSLIHYDSLLANLRDRRRFPRWDYAVHRAIEAQPDPDGAPRLVPLWPARWPLDRLHAERQRVGTLAFEQEYMANPVDDALRVFRPEWLRRCTALEAENPRFLRLMAVDPATGAAGGDFFALWIGAVNPDDGRIYTRSLTLERIGVVEQLRRISDAFDRWKPIRVGIESVAYQVTLCQALEDLGRRSRRYIPVTPLLAAANKRARIEGAAPFFESGAFRLPETLDPEVESQFLHFPRARHDDAPDVCAMAVELARSLRSLTSIEAATAARAPHARQGGW